MAIIEGAVSGRETWKQLAWFAGLWLAGVAALALVAGIIRLFLL